MNWIKRFFASRYLKSIVRYGLVALIAYMVNIPLLTDAAEFLKSNSDELANIITAVLIGLVSTWSVAKNTENMKIEKETGKKVK